MPLIDEIGNNNVNSAKNENETKCNFCGAFSHKINIDLKICESCFNKQVNTALKKIDENVFNISEEIEKVKKFIEEIEKVKKQEDVHIILKNKSEIDLLNAKSTLSKFKIDLETNNAAYILNQNQANEFRKLNKWELFEIKNLDKKE